MVSNKGIKKGWKRYFTRKDYHHRYRCLCFICKGEYYPTYSNAKSVRKVANRKVRRYKGEISDGCNYKKIYDVQWELF